MLELKTLASADSEPEQPSRDLFDCRGEAGLERGEALFCLLIRDATKMFQVERNFVNSLGKDQDLLHILHHVSDPQFVENIRIPSRLESNSGSCVE
jgi:hypothetical protein